jgi:DNA-binding MarR family transcriptional regulator
MGEKLHRRLKQTRPLPSDDEAGLNLLLAAAWLERRLELALAAHGLTLAQYNVLRILRGAGEGGHARCDIAARMIDAAPDVTRLLDRLEAAGFVRRGVGRADRRASVAWITAKGLKVLTAAEPGLQAVAAELAGRVPKGRVTELSRLLEAIYDEP